MSDSIEIIKSECSQLKERLENLALLIECDDFEKIVTNSEERGLIIMQYDAIKIYKRILNKRINILEK